MAGCGGLSMPEKMPMGGYALPPAHCKSGALLSECPGTVCNRCYARKGRYTFKASVEALERRHATLTGKDWVESVTALIRALADKTDPDWRLFRWHDAGDLQGHWHIAKLITVARNLPDVKFWLPTMEAGMVANYFYGGVYIEPDGKSGKVQFPCNMLLRLSTPVVDGEPTPHVARMAKSKGGWARLSVVNTAEPHKNAHKCPATWGKEKTCRGNNCSLCWSRECRLVSYKAH